MRPSTFMGRLTDQLQKFSEGRSNSFFIFSPNRRFILKTLTADEATLLLRIVPNLYQYFLANPATMLPRFYGYHAVRVPHGEIVYVVVMGNVFHSPATIHEQYDLKGSWVNRSAEKEKDPNKQKAGMDKDLKRTLKLDPHRKQLFIDQISKDALFLCSVNIMDYSLLLGFHFLTPPTSSSGKIEMTDITQLPDFRNSRQEDSLSMQQSLDGTEIYYMGIIDILQLYNKRKKAERFLKVYILGKDKLGLSSMPPQSYAKRFIQAMDKLVQ